MKYGVWLYLYIYIDILSIYIFILFSLRFFGMWDSNLAASLHFCKATVLFSLLIHYLHLSLIGNHYH